MSIHPTMTDDEVEMICDSIVAVANHIDDWSKEYSYDPIRNEYEHVSNLNLEEELTAHWFDL